MLGADARRDSPRDTARLASFLEECRALGSLRGFKYFEVFMRGREEMVLCIPTKEKRLEPASLMPTVDLVPVSLRDEDLKKDDTFIFLITGYPRYRCPYVYLRSSHEHLVQDEDKRMPVTLETSSAWRSEDVPLWRMVAEVISMVKPEHINPFQIDMDYLDKMSLEEAVLLTGALLDYLCNMWVSMDPDKTPYMDSVYEDIKTLQTRHLGYLFEQASRK